MLHEDDKLLKRLELLFDDQQADLALFSATLKVILMRREDILAELEASLLKAGAFARRDRPLADLPVVKDTADVSISPGDTPGHRHTIDQPVSGYVALSGDAAAETEPSRMD
jgi:hypothetical protein